MALADERNDVNFMRRQFEANVLVNKAHRCGKDFFAFLHPKVVSNHSFANNNEAGRILGRKRESSVKRTEGSAASRHSIESKVNLCL
jgi:hypothetical protein